MRRTRLWIEFSAFFVIGPVVAALLLPATAVFTVLFAFTIVGLVLLMLTREFDWAELWEGWRWIDPVLVIAWSLATLGCAYAVARVTTPDTILLLPREAPGLMLAIALLYPVLSALPQELVYRPLFFRRYGAILPDDVTARIVLNAALFSLAHLMYWSPTVAAMTFAGGLMFAFAYEARGNFAEALVLHSLSGIIVFALGLGEFFYSGNVTRPF